MAVSGWGSDYGDIARTRASGAAWWLLSFDPHTDTSAMRHNRPGVAVDDEPPPGVPMEHRRSWSTTLNNKRAGLLSLLGRAGWNRRTTTGITRRQCEVVTVLQSRVYACRPRPWALVVSEEAAAAVDAIARTQLWEGTGFGPGAPADDALLLTWIPASVDLELHGADVVLLSSVASPERIKP